MENSPKDEGTSALPRPSGSKLPQLRSNRSSVILDPHVVSASMAENAITSPRLQRNSMIAKPAIPSPTKVPGVFSPPQVKRQSMLMRPGFQTSSIASKLEEEEEPKPGLMSPPPKNMPAGVGDALPDGVEAYSRSPRKSRQSLSDRTVETLSQVPPSPTPSKRRQSGLYSTDSPLRPPSRAMSSLGHARPGSRLNSYPAGRAERPASPTKSTAATTNRGQSSGVGGKRFASSDTPGIMRAPTMTSLKPASKLHQPSGGIPKLASMSQMPLARSKTLAARPTRVKSPIKDLFGDATSRPPSTTVSRTSKLGVPPSGLRRTQQSTRQGSLTLQKSRTSTNGTGRDVESIEDVKASNSSGTLRDAIKQAKAANRNTSGPKGDPFMPRSADNGPTSLSGDIDPSSLDLLDSSHVNILRKRVNNAKENGKLNIAALCLKEIPVEVLQMYDPTTAGEGGPAWYESVDITRLNAADNELLELPEQIFPMIGSPRKTDFDTDDEPSTAIFAGIDAMDVHGNQLRTIPLSLGRLPALTALNISKNQLGFDSLEIISRVTSLKELRMAENSLRGTVPDCIGDMENLETLDLHGNIVTEINSSCGRLSKLKHLDVSNNQLSTLPMEAIFDLQIVEINASRNKLSGSLLPSNIPQVPFLQHLDVSTNALLMLSEVKVDFLALKSINISNNRVAVLPDLSAWQSLAYLNAEENKISEIPTGFTSLKNLQQANFDNNSLLQLEDGIGSMDSLTVFNIQNNPIRERRLLRLTTEDLKSELRGRAAPPFSPLSDRSGSISNFGPLSSRSTSWTSSGDSLDRSNARLKTIDKADLEPLAGETIRTLSVHHNQLSTIPPAIEILGSTLTTLDLSNNRLGKSANYIPHPLTLPALQTLNLTSNALTSLDPLLASLTAPNLSTVILLFNRLSSLPTSPSLPQKYPSLTKLLGSNNQISILDVEAVRGLQVLDVSGNEIEVLPPKLALLQGSLRTLMVTGNKFRVPGWGVLEKGTEEILGWCRRRIPAGEEGAIED
ncbi:hypothetical protein MMC10_010051 [Thelotrema lepadinum]|nr:hypothetical protein [Thelotrema lepadinum]